MPAVLVLLAGCSVFQKGERGIEYRAAGNAAPVVLIYGNESGVALIGLPAGETLPHVDTFDDDAGGVLAFGVAARCGSVPVCELATEIRVDGKTEARAELGAEIIDPQAFGVSYILGAVARLRDPSPAVRFEIMPANASGSYAIDGAGLAAIGAGVDAVVQYARGDTAALHIETGSPDGSEVCLDARVSISLSDSVWMPVAGGEFCSVLALGLIDLRAAIPE